MQYGALYSTCRTVQCSAVIRVSAPDRRYPHNGQEGGLGLIVHSLILFLQLLLLLILILMQILTLSILLLFQLLLLLLLMLLVLVVVLFLLAPSVQFVPIFLCSVNCD